MAYVGKIIDIDGVTGLVGSTLYGTCATAAGTAAKVVTLADFDELMTGVTIHVKFTNANTASSPTLNVNSTGAKAIYRNGAAVGSGAWQAGQVVSFTYTGSQWETNESGHVVVQSSTTTSNYRPIMLGYTNTSTIADLAATTINQVFATTNMFAQPSTGKIFAKEFDALNASNTVTATLHSGGLWLKSYIEGASATYNYNETVLKTYAGKLKSNNGMLITLQGGGLTIVGGGESATSLANLIDNDQSTDTPETPTAKLNVGGALGTEFVGDTEQLLLSSDNNIYFITACQTIANRKPVVLDTSSQFHPGTTNTGSIGTSTYKWGSVYATNINGKLYTTATNPSSETLYYVPFISGATSGNYDQLVNDGLGYRSKEGTASAIGFGLICLGNNVASGTAGNKKGYIRMYASSQNYSQIETTATATRALVIPDMAGNFSILNKNSTGYWGLYDGDASMSNWIRTTTNGFIPVEAGGLDDPHSSLGTSTWAFKNAYIANIYTNKIFPGSGIYYNNASGFASAPWAKTVDFTCTTASVTRWYAFRVYQAYEGTTISSGLLIVSITTNADKVYSSGKVVWVYAAGSLDKDNFAVTYTNTASTSTTIAIWAKCTKRYQGWNVIPLYGGWGSGKGDIGINCYSTTTGAAAYTGTLIASEYADIKNNAANVTGTVAIANGGTGATSRLNALKALTNESVGTNAQYFLTITTSWGKGGFTSVADAKTVLGLKSAAYTESSAYLASSTTYAGSSSAGGAATSANKLNTDAGSTKQPVYFTGGVPTAIGYTIEKSVPSNAVFTDTKVNVTLGTTTKAYLLGTSTTPTSTATAVTSIADTGVYLTTTAGELHATTFKGDLNGTINTATTATTQTKGNNSTKVATTAFVQTAIGDYIPLAGSSAISGDLKMNVTNKGFWLVDTAGNSYPGMKDNNANLWIGAADSNSPHHVGNVYIAAGYNSASSKGNLSINIYTPNAANTKGAATWTVHHTGNLLPGTGLQKDSAASTSYNGTVWTINHSNSVTAVTTASLMKFKYDAQGHITGSSAATSSDLPAHTHYEQDVKFDTSYNYRPIDGTVFPLVPQCLINTMRTNRFAFLPASSITVQHSTDSGSNYTDSGYSDEAKCSTFISRHTGQIKVGPNTSAERTTSMRTMVTITRDSRYTRINRFYIWFSTSGHTVYVDIQYATNAADTTWVDWRTNVLLAGWSGPNLINGPTIAFGANNDHAKKIRFIFRYTSIRSDYKTQPSQVYEIAAYSDHATWTPTNNLMMNDHLYYWNYQQQAFFPAEIKVPTQLRIHNGNYGALFRNDGAYTYILLTDSGSALNGNWNSLRPLHINNATGLAIMNEGLKINTKSTSFLELHGGTVTTKEYGCAAPKIRFTNSDSSQNAELIWDDKDGYCNPAALSLIGNQAGTYFIAPRIRLDSSSTTQALLDFNDANDKGAYLRYSTSTRGYGNIIAMKPYNADGIGVVFNHTGGGYCCIGAGESPSNFTEAVMSTDKNPYGTDAWLYGSEQMCITADNSIYFVSGANGLNTTNHTDWTHLKTALFDTNGYFRPSVDNKGQIGASNYRWNYGYFGTVDANTANITNSAFGPLTITRSGATYGAGIIFKNSNGSLGSIGMTGSADGGLMRWSASGSTTYTVCDTGNTSVTRVLSSGTKIATIKIAGTSTDLYCEKNTNTDTKVNVTLGTTTKAYLLGTSTTPTSTATAVTSIADTGVYLTTTAGELHATTFKGDLNGKINITAATDDTYYIPFISSTSGYNTLSSNSDISFETSRGDTSSTGLSLLGLGNSTAEGSNGNAYGALKLYGLGSNYISLTAKNVTGSNKEIKLPNYAGTVMITGIGDALTSANSIDADTKDITKHWYVTNGATSAQISDSPAGSNYGYHIFNIPTTATDNKYQKQLLFGNTSVIPYMYRYLANGTWSGGWRSPGTGFFYVIGTQTTTTKLWTGVLPLPALYDGLTIAYYLPYSVAASQSSEVGDTSSNPNVWINLTLSNGSKTGWIQAYYQSNSRITTHYGAGSCIILTYFKAGSIKVSGTATTVDSWRHCDYNANSSVNVTLNTTSKAYVLATTSTPTSTATARTAVADTGVYLDTTAGSLTATKFTVNNLIEIHDTSYTSRSVRLTYGSTASGTSIQHFPTCDGEIQVSQGQAILYSGTVNLTSTSGTDITISGDFYLEDFRMLLFELYPPSGDGSHHIVAPWNYVHSQSPTVIWFQAVPEQNTSHMSTKSNFSVGVSYGANGKIHITPGTGVTGTWGIRIYSLI